MPKRGTFYPCGSVLVPLVVPKMNVSNPDVWTTPRCSSCQPPVNVQHSDESGPCVDVRGSQIVTLALVFVCSAYDLVCVAISLIITSSLEMRNVRSLSMTQEEQHGHMHLAVFVSLAYRLFRADACPGVFAWFFCDSSSMTASACVHSLP